MARGTYFDLLGVSRDATEDQIQEAYHRIARKYHPDMYVALGQEFFPESDDTDFVEITRAYNTLKDALKREKYKEELKKRTGAPPEEKSEAERAEDTRLEMAKNSYNRGMAEMKRKRFQSARELFQAAVNNAPEEPEYYSMLGVATIEAGRGFSVAEMNCEKAIAMSEWNAQYHANLGKVYLRANIKSHAKRKFQDALHWDPNNRDAKEALTQLEQKKSLWDRLRGKK